jgi:phage FluMu protein Com
MSSGVRCPHCNLLHSARSDDRCPRCRKNVFASPPTPVAHASSSPKRHSRALVYLVVVVAIVAASGFGYRYYRDQAPLDYSMREGLLEPVVSGEWVESIDASARVQVATDGWYRHTGQETDRILLSNPKADTHVVLRVERTGRGRRTPHAAVIADRAIGRLEQNVTKLQVQTKDRIAADVGNAYRIDADVLIEQTPLAYRYRLAAKPGRVATLVCFGPPDSIGVCPAVLDSFSWSS